MENETIYASIKISDTSSYIQVPKHKWQPNLQQMVFLEKDVKHKSWATDEFWYSPEYLNFADQKNTSHLDALLAIQSWRRFKLDDENKLRQEIDKLEDKSDKKYNF